MSWGVDLFSSLKPWQRILLILAFLGFAGWGVLVAQPQGQGAALLLAYPLIALLLGLAVGLPSELGRDRIGLDQPRAGSAKAAIAGMLLALALLWYGLRQFEGPIEGHGTGWLLYGLAMAVLVASVWGFKGRKGENGRSSRWEFLGLASVLALGLAPRLHQLASRPYGIWFDEAQNGLEAIRILDQPHYWPVFVSGASQLPALLFYYYAVFIEVFGREILSLRLATTLAGVFSIFCVWLLGRELFGPRVGLLAAALLAVCRWHINFSRFAIANIFSTVFIPLTLFFFIRSLRRLSVRDAVFSGLCLGIGLQTYYALLLVPVILTLILLHRLLTGHSRSWVAVCLLLLVFASAAFSYAPVLQYAQGHPSEFGQRIKTVSIIPANSPSELIQLFVQPSLEREETLRKLVGNIRKHLRMFHLEGDRNGRHNLPGAPMLDPITGVLLAIGFLWCLVRALRPSYLLLLLWFGAMISAGVLSLDFEAPQGARSFGLTAVIALISALPLAQASRALAGLRGGRLGRLLQVGLPVVLIGAAAFHSWVTYFHVQLWDPAVWAVYSTPETRIGQVVKEEGENADVYITPVYLGGPTENFILGQPIQARGFEASGSLPLEPSGRPALVFFDGSQKETMERIRSYYPKATLEGFGPPRPDGSQGEPVLWIARLSAQDLEAVRGWRIEYSKKGESPITMSTSRSSWDWTEAPLKPPFEAQVRGALKISQDGLYELVVDSNARATFRIDGEPLMSGRGRESTRLVLARGSHGIDLTVQVSGPQRRTSLGWKKPGETREEALPSGHMFSPELPLGGLLGAYYQGADWLGDPAFLQLDPQVAFYFHVLPLARPFSVEWKGGLYAPQAGLYRFWTNSIDESFLRIGNADVVANSGANRLVEGSVSLEQGWHPVVLRYRNFNHYSQVYLHWAPPGGSRQLVPPEVLRPPGPLSLKMPLDSPPPLMSLSSKKEEEAKSASPRSQGLVSAATPLLPIRRSMSSGASVPLRLVSTSERIYVLDLKTGTVRSISPTGSILNSIAIPSQAGGPLDLSDLAVGPGDRLYVLDAKGAVQVFSPRGQHQKTIDLRSLGVYNPRGLAVSPEGKLLISDTGGGRILECDSEGRILRQFGKPGRGPGELIDPISVVPDGVGGVVVVDVGNERIQHFRSQGGVATVWPLPEKPEGLFSPQLVTGSAGVVWVAGGTRGLIWRLRLEPVVEVESFRLPSDVEGVDLSIGESGDLLILDRVQGLVLLARVVPSPAP